MSDLIEQSNKANQSSSHPVLPDDFRCESKPLERLLNATALMLESPGQDSATLWAACLADVESELARKPPSMNVVVPEECPHMIVFDDAELDNEMFAGAGARPAALRRWEQISRSWNAHLFVRVERNSRDDPYPSVALETPVSPVTDSGKTTVKVPLELIEHIKHARRELTRHEVSPYHLRQRLAQKLTDLISPLSPNTQPTGATDIEQ